MKSNSEITLTMKVSMEFLEFFAEADVDGADEEEQHHDPYKD